MYISIYIYVCIHTADSGCSQQSFSLKMMPSKVRERVGKLQGTLAGGRGPVLIKLSKA